MGRFVRGDVATVHQVFTGPVAGDAFLLLNFDGAVHLVDLLTDTPTSSRTLGASAREVITEVGNILMNACLGVFGNLLRVRFSFSVPKLSLDDLGMMVQSLIIADDTLQHALVVGARFRMRGSEVTGCLVLVLGIASFELFLNAVETWSESSLSDG
jgi:chemotaxis protein CheC